MCTAVSSALASASCTSQGNSPDSSTSAARGAILSSARARTAARSSWCSSGSANAGKSRLIALDGKRPRPARRPARTRAAAPLSCGALHGDTTLVAGPPPRHAGAFPGNMGLLLVYECKAGQLGPQIAAGGFIRLRKRGGGHYLTSFAAIGQRSGGGAGRPGGGQ